MSGAAQDPIIPGASPSKRRRPPRSKRRRGSPYYVEDQDEDEIHTATPMSGAAQDPIIPGPSRSMRRRRSANYVEDQYEERLDNDEDYLGDDGGGGGDDDDDYDEVEDQRRNISCPVVAKKYRFAAKVVKEALKTLLAECVPDAKITNLCLRGDSIINDKAKGYKGHTMILGGIAFPTCVSANGNVCNVCPNYSDDAALANGDIIKINMACHIDGYIATLAHTHVVGDSQISEELSEFIDASAEAIGKDKLQFIVPGEKLSTLHEVFQTSIDTYGFWIAKLHCYKLEQFSSDIDKVDPDAISNEDTFEENEVYVIDLITCSKNVKLKKMPEATATIYSMLSDEKGLHGDALKAYSLIRKNFALRPFTTRALEEDELNSVMNNRDMLQAYPILFVDDGLAAHFKCTIFVKGQATNVTAHGNTFKAKGKKTQICDKLSYCGMVPVGEEGSNEKLTISCISWNKQVKIPRFACTGSFGTMVCTYEQSGDVLAARDLETGWAKEIISSSPAKICSWAPLSTGKFLAVGATTTTGPIENDVVNLYDVTNPVPVHAYTFHVGDGMNSFSWDRKGVHLLVTTNNMNHVVVITRKGTSVNSYPKPVYLPHMKHPKPDKANFVGVFHPTSVDFFVGSSSGFVSMYSFRAVPKGANPWERVSTRLIERGINGITINGVGTKLICTMLDNTVMIVNIKYESILQRKSPALEVVHNLVTGPEVAVKFSRLMGYLATIDKSKLITIYRQQATGCLVQICTNIEDIDPTKLIEQLDAMDWGRDGLLATGGEDGLVRLWYLCHSANQRYIIKKRDHFMEKNFYLKKRLQFGAGEDLHDRISVFGKDVEDRMSKFAVEASTKIQDLENRLQQVITLSSDGLDKLHHGDTLSREEQIKLLEDIKLASLTI